MCGWCSIRASLALAYLALPVMAGGKQPAVSVQGTAPAVCSFSAAQAGQASNITFGTALSSQSVFAINQLIDQTTAQLSPASISIVPNGACNHAHAFTIKSGNVVLQIGISAGSFANRIDYSVSAMWGSPSNAFLTSRITGQAIPETVINRAFSGTLPIQVVITPSEANTLPSSSAPTPMTLS